MDICEYSIWYYDITIKSNAWDVFKSKRSCAILFSTKVTRRWETKSKFDNNKNYNETMVGFLIIITVWSFLKKMLIVVELEWINWVGCVEEFPFVIFSNFSELRFKHVVCVNFDEEFFLKVNKNFSSIHLSLKILFPSFESKRCRNRICNRDILFHLIYACRKCKNHSPFLLETKCQNFKILHRTLLIHIVKTNFKRRKKCKISPEVFHFLMRKTVSETFKSKAVFNTSISETCQPTK